MTQATAAVFSPSTANLFARTLRYRLGQSRSETPVGTLPKPPTTTGGWGETVLAVADGEIIQVVDGFADNALGNSPPVTLDNIAGNHVLLRRR